MKKILMMVMVIAAAMSAKAELLYFMANAFDWGGPTRFDYASVGVAKDGTPTGDYLTIYSDYNKMDDGMEAIQSDADRYYAVGWADVSNYTADGYTFYVEAYIETDGVVDWENSIWQYSKDTAKSYSDLLKAGSIYIPGSTDPLTSSVGSPWVVPEPTSGVLMVLGMALLAIRRKRMA